MVSVWCQQSVEPNDSQNWSLTGKKLHSWVFGSYFSTTSIGDCWLPKPPITSRTSLAPRAKRESNVRSVPSQPKGHLKAIIRVNTKPSLVQEAASKSPIFLITVLKEAPNADKSHLGPLSCQWVEERNPSRVSGCKTNLGARSCPLVGCSSPC